MDRLIKLSKKGFFEPEVTEVFLFLFEMRFSFLKSGVLVIKSYVTELLAGEIEDDVTDFVEAVEIAVWQGNAIDFSTENILYEEGRDRTLAEGFVFARPFFP